MAAEQTVVLLGRMTSFTTECDACVDEQLAGLLDDAWIGARISGALELDDDLGSATCARGHRVRLIRAGRPTPALSG
jgi:hypothetical protein